VVLPTNEIQQSWVCPTN